MSMSGTKLPRRLSVHYISFSAHVDYAQNSAFIDEVGSKNLVKWILKFFFSFSFLFPYLNFFFLFILEFFFLKVLVHGDSNEMGRLKSALQSKYAEKEQPLTIYSPKNCDVVELYFRGEKMAKVIFFFSKFDWNWGFLFSGYQFNDGKESFPAIPLTLMDKAVWPKVKPSLNFHLE